MFLLFFLITKNGIVFIVCVLASCFIRDASWFDSSRVKDIGKSASEFQWESAATKEGKQAENNYLKLIILIRLPVTLLTFQY